MSHKAIFRKTFATHWEKKRIDVSPFPPPEKRPFFGGGIIHKVLYLCSLGGADPPRLTQTRTITLRFEFIMRRESVWVQNSRNLTCNYNGIVLVTFWGHGQG